MSNAIQTSQEIAEYSKTQAALRELAQRYKGVVFDVSEKEGMALAIKGRAEIRGYRVALEKKRVEIKAPALERCKLIDSEAKRITAELVALEDPIDEQIKKEEARKEAERLAAIRAEEARIAAEQKAIKDAEEAKLAEQRAEIARRQAELDRFERERLEAEAASRRKIEEEQREARRLIEAQEQAARKAREAEEARIRAEKEKIDAERRALEERQRKEREAEESRLRSEREAKEKADREKREAEYAKAKAIRDAEEAKERAIQKAKNDLMDGDEMLRKFVARFGAMPEFAEVVRAINVYLSDEVPQ